MLLPYSIQINHGSPCPRRSCRECQNQIASHKKYMCDHTAISHSTLTSGLRNHSIPGSEEAALRKTLLCVCQALGSAPVSGEQELAGPSAPASLADPV